MKYYLYAQEESRILEPNGLYRCGPLVYPNRDIPSLVNPPLDVCAARPRTYCSPVGDHELGDAHNQSR